MADVPNSWGADATCGATRHALRGMIARFQPSSIFAWVPFNETRGLFTRQGQTRTPETQDWVAAMYRLATI
jgi:hypothetical protein